jgi:hypothetical protein
MNKFETDRLIPVSYSMAREVKYHYLSMRKSFRIPFRPEAVVEGVS